LDGVFEYNAAPYEMQPEKCSEAEAI